ncbi:hypothetical protein G6F57_022340 [Rhizopus arrhizus]|nr:hypothetical protein G6F59_016234 [Rhizopus arrhizus]KAG1433196.1 hypothetical protein G6F57_022340 [Rhizopus arrhizus]
MADLAYLAGARHRRADRPFHAGANLDDRRPRDQYHVSHGRWSGRRQDLGEVQGRQRGHGDGDRLERRRFPCGRNGRAG